MNFYDIPGYTELQNFHVCITDKIVIIYHEKIASRYIRNFFGNYKFLKFGDLKFEPCGGIFTTNDINNSETSFIIDEVSSVFNGKSTKDVLIFYRNPLKKFLSGLSENFKIETNIEDIPEHLNSISKNQIVNYIDNCIKNENYFSGLSKEWCFIVWDILRLNIIETKLFIINIDNDNIDLFKIFKKWHYTGYLNDENFSNKNINKLFLEEIESNEFYYNRILNACRMEILYYKKILNHHRNYEKIIDTNFI
jgi:hypothetical protein